MTYRQNKSPPADHRDPMQEFAEKIITSLEAGIKPWVRPWDASKCGGPQGPVNAATGDRYQGINTLILGCDLRAEKQISLQDVFDTAVRNLAKNIESTEATVTSEPLPLVNAYQRRLSSFCKTLSRTRSNITSQMCAP